MSDPDPTTTFATPRIAAGALFVDGDSILLVHKTYGNGWDIPGGYVEAGESPASACKRELNEELGIRRRPLALAAPGGARPAPRICWALLINQANP